jgi:hypothetical protein
MRRFRELLRRFAAFCGVQTPFSANRRSEFQVPSSKFQVQGSRFEGSPGIRERETTEAEHNIVTPAVAVSSERCQEVGKFNVCYLYTHYLIILNMVSIK